MPRKSPRKRLSRPNTFRVGTRVTDGKRIGKVTHILPGGSGQGLPAYGVDWGDDRPSYAVGQKFLKRAKKNPAYKHTVTGRLRHVTSFAPKVPDYMEGDEWEASRMRIQSDHAEGQRELDAQWAARGYRPLEVPGRYKKRHIAKPKHKLPNPRCAPGSCRKISLSRRNEARSPLRTVSGGAPVLHGQGWHWYGVTKSFPTVRAAVADAKAKMPQYEWRGGIVKENPKKRNPALTPVDRPGDHYQGEVRLPFADVRHIIGFAPNVEDDPDKVEASWGFRDAQGREGFVWCYKVPANRCRAWSCSGSQALLRDLFGDALHWGH